MKRAFVAFALAALLAGCSRATESTTAAGGNPWTQHGHLRWGQPDEPDSLNLMYAHTAASDEVANLLFAGLFRTDAHGNLIPELATAIPTYENGGISRDNKTITLHFRKNVQWSDGAPLDARDFLFTYHAVMNDANAVKTRAGWDDIASVELKDPLTAIVHLKEPNADVLGIFGTAGGAAYPPLPEHLLRNETNLQRSRFNSAPISSGPFVLKAWNHGSTLEFAPNPRYWRGAPKLNALTWKVIPDSETLFTQLRTHEIDLYDGVAENQIDRLSSVPGIVSAKRLVANLRLLGINTRRPGLNDRTVRLAIAEAIDWDGINNTVYHGYNVRSRSDIMPDSWAAPKIDFYPYDVDAVNAMLDRAGYARGADGIRAKNGVPLRFTISSATGKRAGEAAEVQIQQQLRAVGIEITIKNYPVSFLFAQNGPLYGGSFDLSWTMDTLGPDPNNQANWSGAFIPPHGANTSGINDAVINRTSDEAIRTFDRGKRKALYQQQQARIHELVPAVFFYWQNTYAGYNSDLKGFVPAQYIADAWNAWEWSI